MDTFKTPSFQAQPHNAAERAWTMIKRGLQVETNPRTLAHTYIRASTHACTHVHTHTHTGTHTLTTQYPPPTLASPPTHTTHNDRPGYVSAFNGFLWHHIHTPPTPSQLTMTGTCTHAHTHSPPTHPPHHTTPTQLTTHTQ